MRLASTIARKYSLSHIIIFTADLQRRSRAVYWGRNTLAGMQCARFCQKAQNELRWETVGDWDSASVRLLKDRIKALETEMARCSLRCGPACAPQAAYP